MLPLSNIKIIQRDKLFLFKANFIFNLSKEMKPFDEMQKNRGLNLEKLFFKNDFSSFSLYVPCALPMKLTSWCSWE